MVMTCIPVISECSSCSVYKPGRRPVKSEVKYAITSGHISGFSVNTDYMR